MKLIPAALFVLITSLAGDPPGDKVPINHTQVIGSHNSFKKAMDTVLFRMLQQSDSTLARHIDYSHIPLTDQLSLGLQNLEIDVFADSKGGRFAHPRGLEWEAGKGSPYDVKGAMQQPGFKVIHITDIDFRSDCATFAECLQALKGWSDAHPHHNPIYITMNARAEAKDTPGFAVPEKFTAEVFDQLDNVITTVLGRNKLIEPDDVRGSYATLEEAVLKGNWPVLKAARGKFLFILDETGEKRTAYIQGHPSLKGRVFFANAEPGTPEAAFVIMNEPVKEGDKIQELVKKGYMVRTRADADTEEARRNDKTRFEAACRSGAQVITTDYYAKSTHFSSDYSVRFPDGTYCRMNPLFTK